MWADSYTRTACTGGKNHDLAFCELYLGRVKAWRPSRWICEKSLGLRLKKKMVDERGRSIAIAQEPEILI